MIQEIEIRVAPEIAATDQALLRVVAQKAGLRGNENSKPAFGINDWRIVRRSVDARKPQIVVNLKVLIATGKDMKVSPAYKPVSFLPVSPSAPSVVIVGAGPAGLFAALRALEHGIRPILLERGECVDERRQTLARINREKKIIRESNYCFGEGGAGAFSDGKLFTRSKKRGNIGEVLELLVQHGADENILVDSHPHIGSDRLPAIIKAFREQIIACGGEVRFKTRVTELLIDKNRVTGVRSDSGDEYHGSVILATGHSARDVYEMLHRNGIRMEAKGIAVGVRLEHPQHLIDSIQYHNPRGRGQFLPAASYSFVTQADGRGVYSFCMCPGGVVVPAATDDGELVVNGMSASARASYWSNSGMVVEIRPGDFPEYESYGSFEMLALQRDLERRFFEAANGSIEAPSQRMTDFVAARDSKTLPPSSYLPGLIPARLDHLLPPFIARRLQEGFKSFDRKARGFLSKDAVLIGLESRTSAPVRIPRDPECLAHPDFPGLYPCGEGAGLAGGIVSAAIDGRRCMDAIAASLVSESQPAAQS